jgi:GTP-binding protein EngB required for normal cell division
VQAGAAAAAADRLMTGEHDRALALLGHVAGRLGLAPLLARIEDVAESSSGTDWLDVVVLGRFKSGKSSLVNALLQRELLPVDVLPATAVVTRIAAGARDRVVVIGEDGAETEIDFADLPLYVTETQNPDNVRRVARVEIELNGVPGLTGLRLVDTPGTGSVHRHNTEATRRWLPKVGAALLAIAADQPLSEQDLSLIREARVSTPVTAIILTKADLVDAPGLERISDYVAREMDARLGQSTAPLPVSIRPGHEALVGRLRRFLQDGIGRDRRRTAEAVLDHKVRSLADGLRSQLEVALATARADAQVRAELGAEIAAERRNLGLVHRELSLIGEHLRQRALEETERRFLAHRGALVGELRADLARVAPGWRGHLGREVAALRKWLAPALVQRLTRVEDQEQDAWNEIVAQAATGAGRIARASQDRLAEKVRRVRWRGLRGSPAASQAAAGGARAGLRQSSRCPLVRHPDGRLPAAGPPPLSGDDRLGGREASLPPGRGVERGDWGGR